MYPLYSAVSQGDGSLEKLLSKRTLFFLRPVAVRRPILQIQLHYRDRTQFCANGLSVHGIENGYGQCHR